MSFLRIPAATYRIQFSLSFRFVDGRDLVPYLNELGITDLYSSPRFKARRGSPHAYDVADPSRINSELGTEQEFAELAEKLKNYGMGLLLDIVPNHMAASSENPWWMDVLENGTSSLYAAYFDIDWGRTTPKSTSTGKVVLPILGDPFGTVLENQELLLKLDENGFFVRYHDHRLPIDPKSYDRILPDCLARLEKSSANRSAVRDLVSLLAAVRRLPRAPKGRDQVEERHRRKEEIKRELWRLYIDEEIKDCLDESIRLFNGTKGEPRSFDDLAGLLEIQSYRIAYWRMAFEEINYRRFFDINDLIGVHMEDPRVFEARHAGILDLIRQQLISGLRVDHVDGLFDPSGYLQRLQSRARDAAGRQPPEKFYVVVEKILSGDELPPENWEAFGTTGYGFLNYLNGLFVNPEGLASLGETYERCTGLTETFEEVRYKKKKLVIETLFAGEIQSLGHHLGRLAGQDRQARDLPFSEMLRALVEVSACLPVYRTYVRDSSVPDRDRRYIEQALAAAGERAGVSPAVFAFLRRVLLIEVPHYVEDRDDWVHFVMRWQQFTGPVMAKGFEDTACYVYSRLVSQNEVGSAPEAAGHPTGLEAFHRRCQRRTHWPYTLNATSTHDTKRSEDVRARINVLSEVPLEWARRLATWVGANEGRKQEVGGRLAPDPNEEIFLYQNLLGAWPLCEEDAAGFGDRIRNFMQKALREAKVNTSWLHADEAYENAVLGFIDAILDDSGANAFLKDFLDFEARIAWPGAVNALSQVLVKIAAPGVPDFYQGSELWDLSLVDPDNRRPVDFQKRVRCLDELRLREAEDRAALLKELLANWRDGRIKLYLTYKALSLRRSNREVFLDGEYLPAYAEGSKREHVCAFARRHGNGWALIAAPRWVANPIAWDAESLVLPAGAPERWENVLTGEELSAPGGKLALAGAFANFPVALLHNESPA